MTGRPARTIAAAPGATYDEKLANVVRALEVDALTCPTCSTADLQPDDMCQHRGPICMGCCLAGEHDWIREGAE